LFERTQHSLEGKEGYEATSTRMLEGHRPVRK
jgi:hypothetical protein